MRKTTIHKYQCDICQQTYEDKAQMNEVKITTYALNSNHAIKTYDKYKTKINVCIFCKKDIEDYIKGLQKKGE